MISFLIYVFEEKLYLAMQVVEHINNYHANNN